MEEYGKFCPGKQKMWLTDSLFIIYNVDCVPVKGVFCPFSGDWDKESTKSRPQPETAVAEPDKPA